MKRIASAHNRTFNTAIVVNGEKYNCWVADTPMNLALGLMGHRLQSRHGCLLDFGRDQTASLWMRNCLHPLTAVFVDKNGVVVGKAEMSHEDPYRSHYSPQPCRYALELLPEEAEHINIGDQIYLETE